MPLFCFQSRVEADAAADEVDRTQTNRNLIISVSSLSYYNYYMTYYITGLFKYD